MTAKVQGVDINSAYVGIGGQESGQFLEEPAGLTDGLEENNC